MGLGLAGGAKATPDGGLGCVALEIRELCHGQFFRLPTTHLPPGSSNPPPNFPVVARGFTPSSTHNPQAGLYDALPPGPSIAASLLGPTGQHPPGLALLLQGVWWVGLVYPATGADRRGGASTATAGSRLPRPSHRSLSKLIEGVDFSSQVRESSGGRPAEQVLFSRTGFKRWGRDLPSTKPRGRR